MTLIWWSKNRSQIDFNPPYQRRGRLWSDSDKSYLVDSIINGFDVPKLYLADFQFGQSSLNLARLPYAIIDGKQRLEAVFDFFDNKITLAGNFKHRKHPDLKLSGLSLKDLKRVYPSVADDFENASLDIMSVFAEDEKDIHDIFVRLNRSKPLTGAEVRNAIVGPVPEIIRTLAYHDFFLENIKFGVTRAGDLNAAAKVLLFEYEKQIAATKKTNLDEFAQNSSIDRDKLELASRRVIDVLDVMADVFIPKDLLLSSSGIFPVYYWFIRNIDRDYISYVREFLIWFEMVRKENRERQKTEGEKGLEPNFSRFDTLNRSTNDLQSHIGRVDILDREFSRWIKRINVAAVSSQIGRL
ncbi:DUF262 domain-containing protein [Bosea sp. AAP35]|uniref:DUF262 domain-containing protein n=1 Tax=Bosea sp. AAP35 TaxID=1523417 RepID=UPI0024A69B60|nr:DUF262 domain-containing protein [Bosea sp. AAP35]